jgi:HSP20 family protein
MQDVSHALIEVKELYQQVLGKPAPEIIPGAYLSFPPGVDPLDHAIEEVAQLKKFSQQFATAPTPTAWVPRADVFATKEGLLVRVEIPGVNRETLKVFVSGNECVVRGELRTVAENEALRPVALERSWGPFERRFVLPAGSRPERVHARYRQGILELEIAGDGPGIPGEMTVEVE